MARWCRLKRIPRDDLAFLLVTLITFLVVLPLLVGPWPHSVYYRLGSKYFSSSLLWFRRTRDDPVSRESVDIKAMAHRSSVHYRNQKPDNNNSSASSVWLLVTIVTVRREGHFYLSRVLGRLSTLLDNGGAQLRESVRVLVCNVDHEPDRHREALDWSSVFPMVQRGPSPPTRWAERFEKERQDYIFCLNASRRQFNFDHVVVLEDDAVPLDDMFDALRYLTAYLANRHGDYFYVKMYHPPRLQGYIQPEPWRIAEWLGASALAALIVSFRFRCRPVYWLAFFMLLFESIGRPHLLELKRQLGPPLGYNLLYATECCMPAHMYSSASVVRAINFLDAITCRPGYAKDTALYYHYRQSNEEAFVIEPNLVEHIGLSSTLR